MVHPGLVRIAADGVEWAVSSDGQDWRVAWHPPGSAPPGTMHGAAAVCQNTNGAVVLISPDGRRWGMPGGRPEAGEDWVDTLRREVLEEACAVVTGHRLLGFSRGICVRGHEQGLVLVRAWYRATVRLHPWQPQHEISHRRVVPADQVLDAVWIEDGYEALYLRVLAEAGLPAMTETPR